MFDYIIRNGRIIDGSGNPWHYGNIGIRSGLIAAMGTLAGADARKVIDASDRVVCPGFIDMHSHSDALLLANPMHEPKVMQGVTTDVLGLDGLSYAPLSHAHLQMMRRYLAALNGNPDIEWNWSSVREYLDRFDRQAAINVAYLVPHNALRLETVGFVDRPATAQELKGMQALMAEGMTQGAFGFSAGLDYFPGRYSDTQELVAICETVAEYDGISVWHTRLRDLGLIEAIKEIITVAERTDVKVHFSHFAANSPANRGKSVEMLAIVDRARDRGLDVSFDSYPYIASSTTMVLFLPRWAHEGGPDAIMERLRDPKARGEICVDIRSTQRPWDRLVLSCLALEKNKRYIGKNLLQAAEMAGRDIAEFVCDLLVEEDLNVGFVGFLGNEEDMRAIMSHPCHTVGSDGILAGDRPHPRSWGAFARYLGVYSRELGVLSLEETIRHMTWAPAQRLGLSDRGIVRKDTVADLVVFDPRTVADRATFDEPKQHPVGIDHVLVNGEIVVYEGKHTGMLNGRVLRWVTPKAEKHRCT